MHAPVQAREVEGVGKELRVAQREGVEEPHVHGGEGIQCGKLAIEAGNAVVVDEQADADAALGRFPQLVEQDQPGRVGLPDVILRVDGLFGGAGEHRARGKGVAPVEEGNDAADVRVTGDGREERGAEPRVGGGGKGGAHLSPAEARQRIQQAEDDDHRHRNDDDDQQEFENGPHCD